MPPVAVDAASWLSVEMTAGRGGTGLLLVHRWHCWSGLNGAVRASRELAVCASGLLQDAGSTVSLKSPATTGAAYAAGSEEL